MQQGKDFIRSSCFVDGATGASDAPLGYRVGFISTTVRSAAGTYAISLSAGGLNRFENLEFLQVEGGPGNANAQLEWVSDTVIAVRTYVAGVLTDLSFKLSLQRNGLTVSLADYPPSPPVPPFDGSWYAQFAMNGPNPPYSNANLSIAPSPVFNGLGEFTFGVWLDRSGGVFSYFDDRVGATEQSFAARIGALGPAPTIIDSWFGPAGLVVSETHLAPAASFPVGTFHLFIMRYVGAGVPPTQTIMMLDNTNIPFLAGGAFPATTPAITLPFVLGYGVTVPYNNGRMKGPFLFTRALTGPEMTAIYNGGVAVNVAALGIPDLEFFYGFQGGSLVDLSGNGHVMTNTSTPPGTVTFSNL